MKKVYYVRADSYSKAISKAKRIAMHDSFGELENNRDWELLAGLLTQFTSMQGDIDRARIQVDGMNTKQDELFTTISDISDSLSRAIDLAKQAKEKLEASFDHENGGDENAEHKPTNESKHEEADLEEPDEDTQEEGE